MLVRIVCGVAMATWAIATLGHWYFRCLFVRALEARHPDILEEVVGGRILVHWYLSKYILLRRDRGVGDAGLSLLAARATPFGYAALGGALVMYASIVVAALVE